MNLTLDQFLHAMAVSDLTSGRRGGHLHIEDRQEVLNERQDIERMRWQLNRNQPQTWIPWILENKGQFVSARFRTITQQGILNCLGKEIGPDLKLAA